MFQVVNKIMSTHLSLFNWKHTFFGVRGKEIECIRSRLQVLLFCSSFKGRLTGKSLSFV